MSWSLFPKGDSGTLAGSKVVLFGAEMKAAQKLDITEACQEGLESAPGAIYEIVMTMHEPIAESEHEEYQRKYLDELPRRVPGLKVQFVEVEGDTIRLQVVGSPFAWALLLPILGALSPLLTGIAIFLLIWKIPTEFFWLIGVALVVMAGVWAWTAFKRPAFVPAPVPAYVGRKVAETLK